MLRTAGLLATLALVISACSQAPADVAAPTLEPQFGSADNDFGVDVALGSSGRIYSLSEREGYSYDRDGLEDGRQDWAVLRRYDASGNTVWSRDIATETCLDADDYNCTGNPVQVRALVADAGGASYSLLSNQYVSGDAAVVIPIYVYKYDAAGNFVRSIYLGRNGDSLCTVDDHFSDAADLAVDGSGNIYVTRQNATFADDDYCDVSYTNVVAKYSPTGSLLWQRGSAVGKPLGISVSSSGLVYVAGSTGVAKYSSAGNLSWAKSGAANDIAAVGTNTVYARNLTTVRKLDASGKQLWSKAQTGLSGMVVGDMTTDSSANVYLTGKYSASPSNRDVFTRKLSSGGATVFTKTFGTSAYDDARGIATLTGSEIYLTGATQGSLAQSFRGGENDGYVRKLNSSGDPVWTR